MHTTLGKYSVKIHVTVNAYVIFFFIIFIYNNLFISFNVYLTIFSILFLLSIFLIIKNY